jgi:hypothetical protein
MSDSKIGSYLKNHPRMIGALFMMMVLLTQAGNAAAANGTTIAGP